jgi:hypothetical protein
MERNFQKKDFWRVYACIPKYLFLTLKNRGYLDQIDEIVTDAIIDFLREQGEDV